MKKLLIHATRRTVTGKQVSALRRKGFLPGVMYGHNFDATPISMDLKEATKILSSVTGSSLVTLELEGVESAALVRERQRDFIKGNLKHIDFQVVSLTEKIRAKVSVELTGLSPAVKDYNGVIVTGMERLEVEALPLHLPERFVIDISRLAKIGEGIYVRDIPANADVLIVDDPNAMLVLVTAPAAEEAVEGGAAGEEPEVIEKGKKEDEAEETGKK